MPFIRIRVYKICNYNIFFFRIRASKYDLMNGIIPFVLFNISFFYFHSYNFIKTAKKNLIT